MSAACNSALGAAAAIPDEIQETNQIIRNPKDKHPDFLIIAHSNLQNINISFR